MAMSGTTYGVNTQTYQHLPPEDQASIRESYLARQDVQEPANETVRRALPPSLRPPHRRSIRPLRRRRTKP